MLDMQTEVHKNDVSDVEKGYATEYERMRLIFSYYAIISAAAFGLILIGIIIFVALRGGYYVKFVELLLEQPASTMGVPICSLIALFNVLLLRTVQGPIEFEIVGFKFRGASGPIIMWILCFLALVWAVGHLWRPPDLPR